MQQEDSTPKIFISYSWSSDQLVLELAQRLVSHGVNVVLDKWDLKEGQDKYKFMEQCVNNSDITKVLIISDEEYTKKANSRTGGVGDETVIISGEVYGKMQQEKFIPIITQRDEDGNPYIPTFIKTRIYIDFSDINKYEEEYEKLLRNIYEKPQFMKPKLGERPKWIDEENVNLFPLKDLIRQIIGSTGENKRRSCISKFQNTFIQILKEYYESNASPERIYKIFLNTKQIRDIYLDYIEAIAQTEPDYAEVLAEGFETMYNNLTCINLIDPNAVAGSNDDIDIFRNLIWELFICVIAFMRNIKDYNAINTVLTYTYFLETNIFGGAIKENNYTEFRYYSHIIENNYKLSTAMKNKYTLRGDIIYHQREKLPIYTGEAIAEADLFLYQVRNAYDLSENEHNIDSCWFPTFYIYVKNIPMEWRKMKSIRHCEKMKKLFGVNSMEDLKKVIEKCTPDKEMRYQSSFYAAPSILDCINIEDIGILN